MAGMATLVAAGSTCFGQTNLTPTVKTTDRDGRIVVSEQQANDLGLNISTSPSSAVDRQNLSDAVKDRLRRFELSRDAYLREQEQLKKRLEGAATEAERERVRALIKSKREDWLRRTRELRTQAKDRIAELRRQLPSKTEVLDAARENARDAISEIRRRRGQD
jgi:flagellar motility protein MotE (MotC chaperone)